MWHLNNICHFFHFTLKNCCGLLSTSSICQITVYKFPWNQNQTDHFHVLYSQSPQSGMPSTTNVYFILPSQQEMFTPIYRWDVHNPLVLPFPDQGLSLFINRYCSLKLTTSFGLSTLLQQGSVWLQTGCRAPLDVPFIPPFLLLSHPTVLTLNVLPQDLAVMHMDRGI